MQFLSSKTVSKLYFVKNASQNAYQENTFEDTYLNTNNQISFWKMSHIYILIQKYIGYTSMGVDNKLKIDWFISS